MKLSCEIGVTIKIGENYYKASARLEDIPLETRVKLEESENTIIETPEIEWEKVISVFSETRKVLRAEIFKEIKENFSIYNSLKR